MQRISVHISDETKQRLSLAARAQNKVESEVLREAINAGLDIISPKYRSAQALLDLAKMAKRLPSETTEPTDVSENLDYYAWGGKKKNEE